MNAIVPATTFAATPALAPITTLYARRLAVVAGVLEDIESEDEDNGNNGYEDADDAAFWSIVSAARNDACPICGKWGCNRAGCIGGTAAAQPVVLSPVGGSGQCSICGGWFDDWPGGVCAACRQNGY